MKKLFAAALALCMAITFCVPVAYAAQPVESKPEITKTMNLKERETTDQLESEGWSWQATERILTVDGLRLNVKSGPALLLPAQTTIVVQGDSFVTAQKGAAVDCAGSLWVNSTGESTILALESKSKGDSTLVAGELILDKGELWATGKGHGVDVVNAYLRGGSLSVAVDSRDYNALFASGKLVVEGGSHDFKNPGGTAVHARSSIALQGGEFLCGRYRLGMETLGGIEVSGGAVVSIFGMETQSTVAAKALSYRQFASTEALTPSVNLGGVSEGNSTGLILTGEDLLMQGGALNLGGMNLTSNRDGLALRMYGGQLNITGGILTAKSTGTGLLVESFSITGGELLAQSQDGNPFQILSPAGENRITLGSGYVMETGTVDQRPGSSLFTYVVSAGQEQTLMLVVPGETQPAKSIQIYKK